MTPILNGWCAELAGLHLSRGGDSLPGMESNCSAANVQVAIARAIQEGQSAFEHVWKHGGPLPGHVGLRVSAHNEKGCATFVMAVATP